MKSRLSLAFPEINSVEHLYVVDTSYYNDNLPVTGQTLEILGPGRNEPVVKYIKQKHFSVVFNSTSLGITPKGVQSELPDGVYEIHYSISPNDKLWVTYYFAKADAIKERLYKKYCAQFSGNKSKKAQESALKKLDYIEQLIKAYKAQAEFLADKEKAIELYQEADRLLDQIESDCSHC
jgi:hypothetical protein